MLIFAVVHFKLSRNVFILLAGHLVLVFCLNYVLFSPTYLGDQFTYLSAVTYIRSGVFNVFYPIALKTHVAGALMAVTPVPIMNSIYALSMANVFLFVAVYILLLKKGILRGFNKLFYLLYPSLALYSAVALRDMWIAVFMCWSVWLVYKKKYLLSVLVSLPLIFIKFQNLLIFILSLFIFQLFFQRKVSRNRLVMIIVFVVIIALSQSFFSINKINFYRRAMYTENLATASGSEKATDSFVPINNIVDLVRIGSVNVVYFMFKPFVWESRKPMQLIQSVENLFMAWIFLKLFLLKRKYRVKSDFLRFLTIYIVIGFAIYGLVVFNFGTAVRYKFPFVLVFIVYFYYELVAKQPLILKEKFFHIGKGKQSGS
jgi:hypothetical protein